MKSVEPDGIASTIARIVWPGSAGERDLRDRLRGRDLARGVDQRVAERRAVGVHRVVPLQVEDAVGAAVVAVGRPSTMLWAMSVPGPGSKSWKPPAYSAGSTPARLIFCPSVFRDDPQRGGVDGLLAEPLPAEEK